MSNARKRRTERICTGCERDTETTLLVGRRGRLFNYCVECREHHDGKLETLR